MSILFCLLLAILQTDVVVSECSVAYCDTNYCNGTRCDQCLLGYYRYGVNACDRCYFLCRDCHASQCYSSVSLTCPVDLQAHENCNMAECGTGVIACFSCPAGFFLSSSRCYQCLNKNCKCSTSSGCDECLPGYYGISNLCSSRCPSNCTSCISSSICTECKSGKYGRTCDLDCLNTCSNGSCDIETGSCPIGCPSGQFVDSNGECTKCPQRCNTCQNYSSCTSCKTPYYWGNRCEFDCPGCYRECNRTSGCSSGCDNLYYQSLNLTKKGYECLHCPVNCLVCNSSSECSACYNGYWGKMCQLSCEHCGGICDKNSGCGLNCLPGHYPQSIDNGHECKPCSDNCSMCTDSLNCTVCKEGFYANEKNQCSVCSANCKDNKCSSTDGTCTTGCNSSQTGNRCDLECPANCAECDQFNSSNCSYCESGFFGESCEMSCSNNCIKRVGPRECNKTDGSCLNGCENGYWTKDCSKPCADGCIGQICSALNGSCLYGCQDGWFGAKCSLKCSNHCFRNKCFQRNGTCVLECVENSADIRCVEVGKPTPPNTSGQSLSISNDDQANTGAFTALAVVVGILFIVAVVSIAVNIIMFRKLKSKTDLPNKHESSPKILGRTIETNDYQDLNADRRDFSTYSSITHDYENSFGSTM